MNSLMCIGFFALGIIFLIKGSMFYAMSSFLIGSVFSISSQLELNANKKSKDEMAEIYNNIVTKIEDNVYENK